jgi:hypothetical protein
MEDALLAAGARLVQEGQAVRVLPGALVAAALLRQLNAAAAACAVAVVVRFAVWARAVILVVAAVPPAGAREAAEDARADDLVDEGL